MDDQKLHYFSRQIVLPSFGFEGQEALQNSHVLIVGCGGLGCSVSLALAGSGIGQFNLVDYDVIERSNLPRQQLFSETNIGQAKSKIAANRLEQQFPHSRVKHYIEPFDEYFFDKHLHHQRTDLIIDAGDSLNLSHQLAKAADGHKIPVVHAAVSRFEGYVYAYHPNKKQPSIKQLFNEPSERESCSQQGVLTPAVGLIANLQACEAVRLLTAPEQISPQLITFDGAAMTFNSIKL